MRRHCWFSNDVEWKVVEVGGFCKSTLEMFEIPAVRGFKGVNSLCRWIVKEGQASCPIEVVSSQ